MKLSTLAAQAAPKKPRLGEVGAVGTTFYSGFTSGVEHNADLTGSKGLDTWERMFRSDGTGKAVKLAYTLPICGANMAVEPAKDSGRSKQMAEAAERMLRQMTPSWEQSLRQELLYLDYGYYLFEPVWTYRDGQYVVEKLAPRPPRTVYRWYLTETGDMAGVQFRAWVPTAHGFGTLPVGTHKLIDIPREKLVHLVNGQEAGNFTGESLGRAMYKSWKMKETIELITMIGVEKREIGTETAQMGPDANEEDARDMARALASLHANGQGYLIVPPEAIVKSIEIFGTGGTRGNATTLIEYHKREMALSGLAGFLTLGDGGGGSYAQSRDKTSLFLIALKAVADYLADVNTRELVHPFCRYNWPGVKDDELPRMTFSGLDTRNMQQYAATLVQLAAGGLLTVDRTVRAMIRADMDLPEETDEIADIADQKAGLMEPPPPEPDPDAPIDEELEPLPEDVESIDGEAEDVPPDNLLLTLDDVPVHLAELAAFDPSRYTITPDGTSKLGYRVVDNSTGKRLSGYAAIKVKAAADAYAKRPAKGAGKGGAEAKGKAEGAKGSAGKAGPDPAKEAEKAARDADTAKRRAEADARRQKSDERRDALDKRRGESDAERKVRQEAADKRRTEADKRREDATAKREADKVKREQDARGKAAGKDKTAAERAADKGTLDAAKAERDGLQNDVAKLDPKAAGEKLKSSGWEPAGGGADAASAVSEARTVAKNNPDKIVTVVKVKGASIVVMKPKSKLGGGKAGNQLSMDDPAAGELDRNLAADDEDESYEIDTGIDADIESRFPGAAERIAGYLFVDRGEGEDEGE